MINKRDLSIKPVIIVGQGPSVEKLSKNIELFRDKDVVWASLNRFTIIEEQVLLQINKRFDVLWWSTKNRFEMYRNEIMLAAQRGVLLMTSGSRSAMFNFPARFHISDFGAGFSSLFAFLCALINAGSREIYLIGFDGYAVNERSVYFAQDQMCDNHRSRMLSIARDTNMTNKVFWDYVEYALNIKKEVLDIKVLSGSALSCFKQCDIRQMANSLPGIKDDT